MAADIVAFLLARPRRRPLTKSTVKSIAFMLTRALNVAAPPRYLSQEIR